MSDSQKVAAAEFAEKWKGRGYEKGESQPFWLALLRDVCGAQKPEELIEFEDQVHLDHTSFIDGYIPSTKVLIEQKSRGKSLTAGIRQSDGSLLTPFQQAKRYITELPLSRHPRWVVTCNFEEFNIYDMEDPQGQPETISLADLGRLWYRLQFLVDSGIKDIPPEELALSVKAGDLVGKIYDSILRRYIDPTSERALRSLNILMVRLVFLLYAEDTKIFGKHMIFHDYLMHHRSEDRLALIHLFKVLDTPVEKRDPYLAPDLAAFPYVNGGLFEEEDIEIPLLGDKTIDLILDEASAGFDWSGINPTIFGAVFESTLNPQTRRSSGMHYTQVGNIGKVIGPLFLDDLKNDLTRALNQSDKSSRTRMLKAFQQKLASLTFFDPACGSGNFLTQTFIELRRMENIVISELLHGQIVMGEFRNPVQVSIGQFFGCEINDFAVAVARTALWIAESQMLRETEDIVQMPLDFLPLKSYTNIVEGNALSLDWDQIVPKERLSYIMGNPPFVGARLMSRQQKQDVLRIFDGWKNAGNLDYVSCWYKKTADFIQRTQIRAALVSTNSITQGEAVANLWQPLFADGVHIDFAWTTFRWDSETRGKAHVHCVIVGFSVAPSKKDRRIYAGGRVQVVDNINGYLMPGPNIAVASRQHPLSDVREIGIGNQPIDGGNYLFTDSEKDAFLSKEPEAAKWFRPWYGADEFINGKSRWCLWLGDCPPNELRGMPECKKRVQAVREYRLASKRASTLKLADRPTRFQVENMPTGNYIVVPEVSSERRRYLPMGYMDDSVLCSNKLRIMPEATLYHFGVLTSNVHMAWVRAVCGRLKSDYDYSIKIVFNNFPWPNPTREQKERIEKTAQEILHARALYPDASLADLYDDATMPPELRTAHQKNDKVVMETYGFSVKQTSEVDCVAQLLQMYQNLTEDK